MDNITHYYELLYTRFIYDIDQHDKKKKHFFQGDFMVLSNVCAKFEPFLYFKINMQDHFEDMLIL